MNASSSSAGKEVYFSFLFFSFLFIGFYLEMKSRPGFASLKAMLVDAESSTLGIMKDNPF